jgi:hypothetical protein
MKRKSALSLLMLAVVAFVNPRLYGWSVEAHQAIGDIAQDLLTQSGQFGPVQAILGNLTLAQISTCADELRNFQSGGTPMSANCQHVFSTPTPPTGTAPWHFIDIPVSLTSPTHADVMTACANNCVLTQIDHWGSILADKSQSNAARLQALAFIVHFIGDLHQPLHSATRGSDNGGNAEQVSIDGGTTSLHHAWDFNLVNDIDSDPTSLALGLSAEIASAQAEPTTTPEGWALQSFQFARTVAYAGIPTSGTTTLSSTYIANAEPVVRQQIARGGVRLAAFLANALSGTAATPLPRPDHVVVVMEENHSFASIIGSSQAPFINSLVQQGALFTHSFAIEHPSQPNYLDLFSGSNRGVTSDNCPQTFSTENLASELSAAGRTFTGFSEDLPSAGSTVCTSGEYARKHAPWINFTNVAAAANQPFTSFPTDFTTLPTISFVIPNLLDDMHDGTISQGDAFLQQHLSSYIQFAQTHNSLLIVTWDEDDNSASNQIPTIFVGPMVKQGQFSESINHFSILRTLEDMYGLTHAGSAANAAPITDVWQQAAANFSISASPTSVSVAQGRTGSTTITTTVGGGFSSSVSLSVSGLPSGVSASLSPALIPAPGSGSSTLTFTAASTAASGTSNVTVTASGLGVTHTTTIALTIGSANASQLLGNPGFENGSSNPSPWTVTTSASPNRVINSTSAEPPHSGTWDAWLDGHGKTTTDSIVQQVSIPANVTAATLSFFLHVDTAETTTTRVFDKLTVQVRNASGGVLSTLATFSNLDHAPGYQQHTFDLTAFKGQTIQVFLQGSEDFELQTSFVVDDLSLQVSQ